MKRRGRATVRRSPYERGRPPIDRKTDPIQPIQPNFRRRRKTRRRRRDQRRRGPRPPDRPTNRPADRPTDRRTDRDLVCQGFLARAVQPMPTASPCGDIVHGMDLSSYCLTITPPAKTCVLFGPAAHNAGPKGASISIAATSGRRHPFFSHHARASIPETATWPVAFLCRFSQRAPQHLADAPR